MCGAHLLSEVVGREVVEDEMDAVLKSFGGFWEGVATVHGTQQRVNVGCVKDGQWPLGGGEGMSGRGGDKGKERKVGTRGEGDEGKKGKEVTCQQLKAMSITFNDLHLSAQALVTR